MRFHRSSQRRSAKTLAMFALLLPVLLGLVGLVIDGGLVLANMRVLQNAADAAAMAGATDLMNLYKQPATASSTATATATAYVQQYNGLSSASVTVNIPPQQGTYAGNSSYIEVIVTNTVNTWFIQVLGAKTNQSVT